VNVNDGGILVSENQYQPPVNIASSSAQEVAVQVMREMSARVRMLGSFHNSADCVDGNKKQLLYRLAHVISPKDPDVAKQYAQQCLNLGLDFNDAIKTLQVHGQPVS
jgi:DNA-binding FadR family transcriptional regulator